MSDLATRLNSALDDFVEVARLAGSSLDRSALQLDAHPAPHDKPKGMPHGMAAVYTFWHEEECIKVGKAAPGSNQRFVDHHYNGQSGSTLSASLMWQVRKVHGAELTHAQIGAWMLGALHRMNIFLPYKGNEDLLGLLEAFMITRFMPRFEGKRRRLPESDTLLPKLISGEVRVKGATITKELPTP